MEDIEWCCHPAYNVYKEKLKNLLSQIGFRKITVGISLGMYDSETYVYASGLDINGALQIEYEPIDDSMDEEMVYVRLYEKFIGDKND